MSTTRANVYIQTSVVVSMHMVKTVELTSVVLQPQMVLHVQGMALVVLRVNAHVMKDGMVPTVTHLPAIGQAKARLSL